MFIEGNDSLVKSYGQNQNGIKAFNYCNVSTDGILGVLRLKELEVQQALINKWNGTLPTTVTGESSLLFNLDK